MKERNRLKRNEWHGDFAFPWAVLGITGITRNPSGDVWKFHCFQMATHLILVVCCRILGAVTLRPATSPVVLVLDGFGQFLFLWPFESCTVPSLWFMLVMKTPLFDHWRKKSSPMVMAPTHQRCPAVLASRVSTQAMVASSMQNGAANSSRLGHLAGVRLPAMGLEDSGLRFGNSQSL